MGRENSSRMDADGRGYVAEFGRDGRVVSRKSVINRVTKNFNDFSCTEEFYSRLVDAYTPLTDDWCYEAKDRDRVSERIRKLCDFVATYSDRLRCDYKGFIKELETLFEERDREARKDDGE